jgi:glycerophosphoryl diester phosphodiesterase
MPSRKLRVVGHRGVRSRFPENTLKSISAAIYLPGIYGVEFDLELTIDMELVGLHQETLGISEDKTARMDGGNLLADLA